MRQAAGGRHAEVGLRRVGAQPGQQVRQLLHRHGRGHGQAEFVLGHLRHGLEVLVGVVAGVLEHQRRHHHDGRVGQQQHVLVGGRVPQLLRRQAAAGAGAVLHQHGLAQPGAQAVGHQARGPVAGAAGGVGHDDAQRRVGGLGVNVARRAGQGGGAGGQQQVSAVHGVSPRLFRQQGWHSRSCAPN